MLDTAPSHVCVDLHHFPSRMERKAVLETHEGNTIATLSISEPIVPPGASPLTKSYLSKIEYCCAVHDFQHPGVNNDFLIKTRHPLAVTHNVSDDETCSQLRADCALPHMIMQHLLNIAK